MRQRDYFTRQAERAKKSGLYRNALEHAKLRSAMSIIGIVGAAAIAFILFYAFMM